MAKIYLERSNKTIDYPIDGKKELNKILAEFDISVSSVILVVNGEIAMEDMEISNEMEVKILSVVSGG